MNKTKAVKFVLGIIFFGISFKFFADYLDFSSSVLESEPVVYSFVKKRINRGGRGESYDMIIEYKNRERTISITSKEYDLIEKGDFPELFYSKNTDSIFSKWSIKLSLRVSILFLLLSIVAILPWRKLVKQKSP